MKSDLAAKSQTDKTDVEGLKAFLAGEAKILDGRLYPVYISDQELKSLKVLASEKRRDVRAKCEPMLAAMPAEYKDQLAVLLDAVAMMTSTMGWFGSKLAEARQIFDSPPISDDEWPLQGQWDGVMAALSATIKFLDLIGTPERELFVLRELEAALLDENMGYPNSLVRGSGGLSGLAQSHCHDRAVTAASITILIKAGRTLNEAVKQVAKQRNIKDNWSVIRNFRDNLLRGHVPQAAMDAYKDFLERMEEDHPDTAKRAEAAMTELRELPLHIW